MTVQKETPLIVVEGIDGVGKSTFCRLLVEHLKEQGISAIITKEPANDTPQLKCLRSVLLDYRWSLNAEIFLHSASRAEHMLSVVIPSLKKGTWVVCDRFVASFLVYQGEARKEHASSQLHEDALPSTQEHLATLIHLSTAGIKPYLTFFLDAPLKQLEERLKHRGEKQSFYEQLGESFFKTAQQSYQKYIQEHSQHYYPLDATQTPEILVKSAWEKLSSLYTQNKSNHE